MKKCILLFALVCTHILLGQNLIENPGFEIGPTPTHYSQIDYATGWNQGCRWNYTTGNLGTPDLYDRSDFGSCYVETVLLPHVNGLLNNRYVHLFNISNDPPSGESIKGTIIEPLSEDYSYEVSCYVSREINIHDDDEGQNEAPLQLEFVLRNNDNCELEKIVHTSTYVNGLFYGNCGNLPSQPSSAWDQKKGYFNLDAGDINENYNRLEIRIKGNAGLNDPIFIDDVELKRIPKVKACFEIKNIDKESIVRSDYGPQVVKELCLPRIEIDGSCSENEDGYHLRISEFSMSPWGFVDDYYEGWVASGTAPSTIDLTTLIGTPSANNGWTSRTFDPTKLYSVSLSVGPIWDSAPLQFFTVKDCNELKACFEIKNIDSEHFEDSDYGPQSVKELCIPNVEIDGSCSENEEGYHLRISEFNLSPWGFVDDYYEGWVATGNAPSTIDLTSLIGTPSVNNGWTSRTFDPTKLYSVSLSVGAGPNWDSAQLQFFRVKNCQKDEGRNLDENLLSLYPNPTQDYINVSFNKNETGTIALYSFDGNLLYKELFNESKKLMIDLNDFNKGLYLVKILIDNEYKIYRIIKE